MLVQSQSLEGILDVLADVGIVEGVLFLILWKANLPKPGDAWDAERT